VAPSPLARVAVSTCTNHHPAASRIIINASAATSALVWRPGPQVRAALPRVKIVVDKWPLVALANAMVTEVRQRVTPTRLGPN
jgi:hypothetical protein